MRLTSTQLKAIRIRIASDQGNRCALCKGQLGIKAPLDPVLDHDHKTGSVRGVLHRGCNSLLGKVENNAARYGVRDVFSFTNGVADYLRKHLTNITGYIHPTFKSPDEKRLLRNKRARISRARNKEIE